MSSSTGLSIECAPGFDPIVEGGHEFCVPTDQPTEIPCWGREHEYQNPNTGKCKCDPGYARDIDTLYCVPISSYVPPGPSTPTTSTSESELHPEISRSKVPETAYASFDISSLMSSKRFWSCFDVATFLSYGTYKIMVV